MNENNLTVTIRDMMECREVRASLQKQYIDEYAAPVISFCMNIPGPVKTNDNILHGFESGKAAILSALTHFPSIVKRGISMQSIPKTGSSCFNIELYRPVTWLFGSLPM